MRTSSPLYPSLSKIKHGASTPGYTTSLGYPLILHWLGLATALGLLLYSAIQRNTSILAFTTFFLVLAIVSWLWSRQSLQKMSCLLTLSQKRAFPGGKIDLNFEATNSKWLFLPWMEIEAELPYKLATGNLKAHSHYSKERLRWTTSISGGQRITWKHCLECQARGDYQLGPVRLRSGDMFGLFPREIIMRRFEQLLVYPKIVPVDKLNLLLSELVGETAIPRDIYEDTSRTMGVRDYQYDDSFKRIHWKASAHSSQLQARQYESTTSLKLLLILDAYSFYQGKGSEEPFELAVTTAASLAYESFRQNLSFGLVANSMPEIRVPISSGRSQLLLLLEALARIQATSRVPLEEQLNKYRDNLSAGTTLVIITHGQSASLSSLVHKLCHGDYSLLLVSVGRLIPASNLFGTPVISVMSLNDLSGRYQEAKL